MDLILWPYTCYCFVSFTPGFNPCFGGSYIVTTLLKLCKFHYLKFQSLFWWILYCDYTPNQLVLCFLVVSILVLVDLILWHLLVCFLCVAFVFQSLFWWILYCDCFLLPDILAPFSVSILVLVDLILWPFHLSNHYPLALCFNPCFGGSYIVTLRCLLDVE